VVSLVTLLLIRLPPMPRQPVDQSAWQHLVEGLRYAWHDRRVRFVLVAAGALSLLGRPFTQIMPVFARDVFDVGPEGLGLLLTMPALGTIAAAILLSVLSPKNTLKWLLGSGVVLAISLTLFGMSSAFGPALAALLVCGGAGSASATLANTLLQQVVDERLRGRVMSFFMAATWGAWRLGALPAGLVAQVWGAPLATVVSGLLLLALLAALPARRALVGQARGT